MPKTHLEWQNFCPFMFKIACSKKKKTNSGLVVSNNTMLVLNDTELCQTALCFFQHSADRHCDF